MDSFMDPCSRRTSSKRKLAALDIQEISLVFLDNQRVKMK